MSLDIYFTQVQETEVHWQNITHNLTEMANEAGFYQALWHPEQIPITTAKELLPYLQKGISEMRNNPEKFKVHSSKNGWGTYDQFLPWIDKLIDACVEYPDSKISVSI